MWPWINYSPKRRPRYPPRRILENEKADMTPTWLISRKKAYKLVVSLVHTAEPNDEFPQKQASEWTLLCEHIKPSGSTTTTYSRQEDLQHGELASFFFFFVFFVPKNVNPLLFLPPKSSLRDYVSLIWSFGNGNGNLGLWWTWSTYRPWHVNCKSHQIFHYRHPQHGTRHAVSVRKKPISAGIGKWEMGLTAIGPISLFPFPLGFQEKGKKKKHWYRPTWMWARWSCFG